MVSKLIGRLCSSLLHSTTATCICFVSGINCSLPLELKRFSLESGLAKPLADTWAYGDVLKLCKLHESRFQWWPTQQLTDLTPAPDWQVQIDN